MVRKRFDVAPKINVKDEGMLIQQATGSTANLFEIKDAYGNTLISFSSSGIMSTSVTPSFNAGISTTNINASGDLSVTGGTSLSSNTSIGNVSSTEISYLDGVSSAIQTQLNNKVSNANNAITQSNLSTNIPLSGFRNAIINGSFDIWQRGSSRVSTGFGQSDYGPDRWRFGNNGNASQYTLSRVTNTSSAPCLYAMRLTSAYVANGLNGIEYLMEYQDVAKLWGTSLTLSFWVRASTSISISTSIGTGTATNDIYPAIGNGLTGAASVGGSTVSVTTSWQRVSISTSTIPSTAGQLRIILVGSSVIANGVWIEFAGVQLENGSQVTPFEQRPVGIELALCQRYYEKTYDISTTPGTNVVAGARGVGGPDSVASTYLWSIWTYKVEKRATPTVTLYDISGNSGKITTWQSGAQTPNVTPSNGNWQNGTSCHLVLHQGSVAGWYYQAVSSAEL